MNYNVGDIVEGTVTRIEKYGLFINVDNNNMFCHISEVSSKFIKNINDLYKIGDSIKAKIILLDNKKQNVSIKVLESYKEQTNNKSNQDFNNMLEEFLKSSNEKFSSIESRNKKRKK